MFNPSFKYSTPSFNYSTIKPPNSTIQTLRSDPYSGYRMWVWVLKKAWCQSYKRTKRWTKNTVWNAECSNLFEPHLDKTEYICRVPFDLEAVEGHVVTPDKIISFLRTSLRIEWNLIKQLFHLCLAVQPTRQFAFHRLSINSYSTRVCGIIDN